MTNSMPTELDRVTTFLDAIIQGDGEYRSEMREAILRTVKELMEERNSLREAVAMGMFA